MALRLSEIMIENIDKYLKIVDSQMKIEDAIKMLKKNGASQIITTKVLMKLFNLKLKGADNLVQTSVHWKDFVEGNQNLKENWFKDL